MTGMEKFLAFLLCALVAGGGVYWYGSGQGWFEKEMPAVEPPTVNQPIVVNIPQQPVGQTIIQTTTTGNIPIDNLKALTKNKYTMASISGDSSLALEFYKRGSDVSDPNNVAEDNINVSTGSGTTTNRIVMRDIAQEVYFDGVGVYYDEKVLSPTVQVNPETGYGTLLFNGQSYLAASPFGTFVNQDTLPEDQGAEVNDTGTDSVGYDESEAVGSAWIRMDIGNSAAQTDIVEPVLCFGDSDSDMENDEITAITATYVSGSNAVSLPGNLLTRWTEAMGTGGTSCVKIADRLGGAEKARWELTFTVTEGNFGTTEEFEIIQDDLGDYKQKQYPSRNVKATAETLTFGDQA